MGDSHIKIGIVGASGYTGADCVRLLSAHPYAHIGAICAQEHAGQNICEIFPQFASLNLPILQNAADIDWSDFDAAICALPHGVAQDIICNLPSHLKIIDMSADFRLQDKDVYAQWYGRPHIASALLAEAVYGLCEHNASAIASARLVACPGCYPTAALLVLLPLLYKSLLDGNDLIIDAKSGVSGMGRGLKVQNLFCEISESMHAYSVADHRHAPEIEQELSKAVNSDIKINFTPHLIPMNRGEFLSIYARRTSKASTDDIRNALVDFYADKPFVDILEAGKVPASGHVRGSNFCHLAVFEDRIAERVILFATLDNLVKGSSGQAIQNMNLMFGFDEDTGLTQLPLFP